MTLVTPGKDVRYINNAGSMGLEIINPSLPGNGSPAITYIGPDGKVINPNSNPVGVFGSTGVRIILWADGSIQQSHIFQADGSQVDLLYNDAGAGAFLTFGPGGAYSMGTLKESIYTSAAGLTIDQHFAAGHLTQYNADYQDIHLAGSFNAATGTSTVSLQNLTYTTALTNSGVGNIDRLIGQDGSSLISNDGSTLIGDAGGTLIGDAGGTLIGQDGSSLIGDAGGTLNLLDTSSLIGQDGSSLIGQDGSSLISTSATGIFSGANLVGNDGSSVDPAGSSLVGNDGSSFAANFMANAKFGVSHYSLASFSPSPPPADDPNESSNATTDTVSVGGPATNGTLEKIGDRDWFKVSFTAGQTYVIDLKGAATGDGTLVDPWLRVYDPGSTLLAQIDDGGTGFNSRLTFTANATGTFYIVAGGRGDASTGTYTVSVASVPQTLTIDPVAGDNIFSLAEQSADAVAGLVVSGTTVGVQVGHAVTVSLNGHNYSTTVIAGGSWQTTVPAADVIGLGAGMQQVAASVAGNPAQTFETFSVVSGIHPEGNAFNDPLFAFPEPNLYSSSTAILANGTLVEASFWGPLGTYGFQLFNSSGTAIGSPVQQSTPSGRSTDMKVVPLAGGGFALVFAVYLNNGATNFWSADFFNSAGVALQTNVQLVPLTNRGGGAGYDPTNVTVTATPNGGFFMAENYSAHPHAPLVAGQPGSFPVQNEEVGGSFYDSTGHLLRTIVLNDVLKASLDGIAYSGLDGDFNTVGGETGVPGNRVAALADGSVAVAYLDEQYQFDTPPPYSNVPNSRRDISVEVVSPTGGNLWIDVHADASSFYLDPAEFGVGDEEGTVALSGSTFGVIWAEGDTITDTTSLRMKIFDETGDALSGEITLANNNYAGGGYTAEALPGGNFAFAYGDTAVETVVEVVSSTGSILDSIVFPDTNLGSVNIQAAPDGSFYITTASNSSPSGFQTQHYSLGPNLTISVQSTSGVDLRWAALYDELANSPIGAGGIATQYTAGDNGHFNGHTAAIKFVVSGTGLTYNGVFPNIQLTGGTITGIQEQDSSGNALATFSGLSLSAAVFNSAIATYVAGGTGSPNPSALNAIFLTNSQLNPTGSSGADHFQGGAFANNFVASAGNDSYDGGTGASTVAYSGLSTPGLVAIIQGGSGTINKGGAIGVDTLTGIESLIGSTGNDVFYVDANEKVAGRGAFDYLIELTAGVNLSYGVNFTGVTEFVSNVGNNIANFANDTSFAYLYGSTGNDTLTLGSGGGWLFGEGGVNVLTGGANATNLFVGGGGGSDTMNGGGGTASNFYFVDSSDQIDGAGAFNTVIELVSGVTVQLGSAQYQDVQEFVSNTGNNAVTVANTDADFVYLYGGAGNDTLSTGSGGGYLFGEGGTNVLTGGGGLNVFVADNGLGVDTMNGGSGSNIYFIDANSHVHGAGTFNTVIELQQSASLVLGSAQLGSDVQQVILNGGTNSADFHTATSAVFLYGGAGNDTLFGGTGNDFLYGGAGTNTFAFQQGWGHDTIMDWTAGTNSQIDLTALSGLGVHAVPDLTQTITAGNDVITSIHTGTNSITLLGVGSALTASSFHFA